MKFFIEKVKYQKCTTPNSDVSSQNGHCVILVITIEVTSQREGEL